MPRISAGATDSNHAFRAAAGVDVADNVHTAAVCTAKGPLSPTTHTVPLSVGWLSWTHVRLYSGVPSVKTTCGMAPSAGRW